MVALVTGASSGIGRDIARSLAMHGISLILTARRRDRLSELKREIVDKYGVALKSNLRTAQARNAHYAPSALRSASVLAFANCIALKCVVLRKTRLCGVPGTLNIVNAYYSFSTL